MMLSNCAALMDVKAENASSSYSQQPNPASQGVCLEPIAVLLDENKIKIKIMMS